MENRLIKKTNREKNVITDDEIAFLIFRDRHHAGHSIIMSDARAYWNKVSDNVRDYYMHCAIQYRLEYASLSSFRCVPLG